METFNKALAFIDEVKTESFTGGIKMGFEAGKLSSIAKSTNPDTDVPKVTAVFSIEENIKKACSIRFYGTLFFIFENGLITHYYYTQTFQGRVLEEALEPCCTGTPIKKTRLVVTRA